MIFLAVSESVPGRKRPRQEVTVKQTPVYAPVYVTGRSSPRCWTEYHTEYTTVHENGCQGQYHQSCSATSYREECSTEYSLPDLCFDKRRRRREALTTDCTTKIPKERCYRVPERRCHSVPKQICKGVPVRRASQVGRQVCSG